MRLDLFQSALRGAAPEAAQAFFRQLLESHADGRLGSEAAADVAVSYLDQHAAPPQEQQQQQQEATAAAAGQQDGGAAATRAAVEAVPPPLLRMVLELPVARCRRRLLALARRCPPLLGQLLCAADPRALLAEGTLSEGELLATLEARPPAPALPALAAVSVAAALLAQAPPGPSRQLLQLLRVLAEGQWLMAIVEAGHLAPADLRSALAGAPHEAYTDIFRVRAAGWSLLVCLCVCPFLGVGLAPAVPPSVSHEAMRPCKTSTGGPCWMMQRGEARRARRRAAAARRHTAPRRPRRVPSRGRPCARATPPGSPS